MAFHKDQQGTSEITNSYIGSVHLNRHHLAVFDAVAAAGRVGTAAQRLHISQPAVSKQVAALERAVGEPLFDRLPRGMQPTATGRLLFEYTQRIEALHARLLDALAAHRELREGQLALGASSTIGVYLVPDLLRRLRRAHPAIAVHVAIGNTAEIEARVLDGSLDFGLIEGPQRDPAVRAREFARDRLVAVAAPGHDWARGAPLTAAAFCQELYLAREEGSGTRAVVEGAFAAKGMQLQPAMELEGTDAVKAFVAAGHGVSVLSRLTVREEVSAGRLIARDIDDLELSRTLSVIRAPGRSASRAAAAALALVRTVRAASLPE